MADQEKMYSLTLNRQEMLALFAGWGVATSLLIGDEEVADMALDKLDEDHAATESLTRKLIPIQQEIYSG